jgi:uncharacterized membrane protein SirB2
MIAAIVKELIGLFVDDELLAAAIVCVVALVSMLTFSGVAPDWLAGLLLTVALPVVLAASVLRSARRATRSK